MSTQASHRPARARRLAAPLATFVGVGAAWIAVAALQLADGGPTPCPWRTLTGLDCPFCGATRAAASLARGDLITALDHNALFVLVIVPLALVVWLAWIGRAWQGRPAPVVGNRAVAVLMAITVGWWALRLSIPWLGSVAT